jgi:hypothetical protein
MINPKAKPLPPWERAECRVTEVPAVLQHLYAINVSAQTPLRWMRLGLPSKANGATRVRLKTITMAGRKYVRLEDLKTFMEET